MTTYRTACASALLLAATATASAETFPSKPLTIVVPFSAGTAVDVNGRDFALALTQLGTVSTVVDNKPGADGNIGALTVLNARPDGHTILFTSSSTAVMDPLTKQSMQFNPATDLTPLCTVARTSNVLNITGSSPIQSVAELIAAAKAKPGKMTYAYTSATTRAAGALFQQAAGISLVDVAYKVTMAGLTDVASGEVDLFFIDHVSVMPLLQSGKIRALAVAGDKRIAALPNVPSAKEVGVPAYAIQPWFGAYVSSKTPPDVVARLRQMISGALGTPEVKAAAEKRGQEPYVYCGDAMIRMQSDEIDLWRGVLKRAGIEPQ